jgi:hypothetical protein
MRCCLRQSLLKNRSFIDGCLPFQKDSCGIVIYLICESSKWQVQQILTIIRKLQIKPITSCFQAWSIGINSNTIWQPSEITKWQTVYWAAIWYIFICQWWRQFERGRLIHWQKKCVKIFSNQKPKAFSTGWITKFWVSGVPATAWSWVGRHQMVCFISAASVSIVEICLNSRRIKKISEREKESC